MNKAIHMNTCNGAAHSNPVAHMSSDMALQTFSKDFGEYQAQLTILLVDGEPWFKGAEAAAALGYVAPAKAVRAHVDEEDRQKLENLRGTISVPLTNPNEGASIYISESGLYSLVMSSKLPCAKVFKRWVLKEVLPSIRRTGSYSAQPSLEEEEDEIPTLDEPPQTTDVQQWEGCKARLDALSSAHALAQAAGLPLSDSHTRAMRKAINDTFLPADPSRIDAAEFLRRKGHVDAVVRRLAPELGKALKAAWLYRHGDIDTVFETGIGRYRVWEDALFMEEVYNRFKERDGYAKVCGESGAAREAMARDVNAALTNARGFVRRRASNASAG